MQRFIVQGAWLCAGALALASTAHATTPSSLPLLFMNLGDDVSDTYGRIQVAATSAQLFPTLRPPPCNYTGGATVFASFVVVPQSETSSQAVAVQYEVFVMVGRPGEPIRNREHADPPGPPNGVAVQRYVTSDFMTYSDPIQVLYLPDGSGARNDGSIWTIKSLDRDVVSGTYLLLASYGSSVHSFRAVWPTTENSFKPTSGDLKDGNFKDHDDANVIFHAQTERWVDMQIMYQKWDKKYCDNVNGYRRTVSVRTSTDGLKGKDFSDDWGCLEHPQTSEHCKKYNLTNMIVPGEDDPKELEFYRIRPFYLETSLDSMQDPVSHSTNRGRLMSHVLLYVPSPSNIVLQPDYGRQPLWYCKDGCCHGPHMYEEWWVGPSSGDPTEMTQWTRPAFDTHAFPHDVWAMSQPVLVPPTLNGHSIAADGMPQHIWVTSGSVYGIPMHQVIGLFSAGNAEITSKPFYMPASVANKTDTLVVNANIPWQGGNHVGGADEGRQAYLMAELRNASTGKTIPGFEKEGCVLMNVTGVLPLAWNVSANVTPAVVPANSVVQLRLYFRATTVYSVGLASTFSTL